MLDLAGVKYTADTSCSLISTLNFAWAEVQQKQRIPRTLFKSINDSVKRTQKLLQRLERDHLPDIATDEWAVLDGRAITPGKMFDEVPPGATLAAFNRQQMLDRLLREIARYNPKRKRGHQQEGDKFTLVARAGHFFRQYSPRQPTSYSNGSFVKFCKRFYEVVTGKPISGSGLEKLIKREVKTPTIGTQMVQKT